MPIDYPTRIELMRKSLAIREMVGDLRVGVEYWGDLQNYPEIDEIDRLERKLFDSLAEAEKPDADPS